MIKKKVVERKIIEMSTNVNAGPIDSDSDHDDLDMTTLSWMTQKVTGIKNIGIY